LQSAVVLVLYAVGILASVFHLANGLWTMGITWGVWTSPAAQRRANWLCTGFGLLLAVVGLAALYGMYSVDQAAAQQIEDKMYDAKLQSGEVEPAPHKRR
jgi:succinate dehydrogenase / fumarate reductase cytochrome b subunit